MLHTIIGCTSARVGIPIGGRDGSKESRCVDWILVLLGMLFLKDEVCKVLGGYFLKVFDKPSLNGWFEDFDC